MPRVYARSHYLLVGTTTLLGGESTLLAVALLATTVKV
jgi:hypothetical protein